MKYLLMAYITVAYCTVLCLTCYLLGSQEIKGRHDHRGAPGARGEGVSDWSPFTPDQLCQVQFTGECEHELILVHESSVHCIQTKGPGCTR